MGSSTASLRDTRSAELYARAVERLPGGVNSPVRAMRSIGRDPIFVERAAGAEMIDVDGNRYVDWVCSWGPLIHGHAHPEIVAAVTAAAERGTSFGAPTAAEVDLADEVARRMPGVAMMRMTSSGTEASMSAIRLARAATGREKILKFAGAYHGHVDGLLAEAGSGLATQAIPASPGVPEATTANTVIVPWNDAAALREATERHELAALLCEPYAANMGLVPPADRLPGPAARARHGDGRAARLRRGHHRLPAVRGRRAGAVRRPARPDRARQGRRWRAARRRLRGLRRSSWSTSRRPATSTRRAR